jgi:diguanylate cyclase (GGDEF)-like protein
MKVLIAEDDVISSRALACNIEEWGYEVVVTRNGQDAWQILNAKNKGETNEIQIAVLDWEMPKINGIDLCRKIRNRRRSRGRDYIYIILMTGRDHQEDILQGLMAGADDYMTKPFDPIELKIRLQNGQHIIHQTEARENLRDKDEVTGLWNRGAILRFLDEEIIRNARQNQPTAVILLNIPGLRRINDRCGCEEADRILIEMSARLKSSMRYYDKLGRIGEDEFLAVFPNCRTEHIKNIGERLRRAALEESSIADNPETRISIYLGGASSEYRPRSTSHDLLEASRQALRSAMDLGSATMMVLSPGRNP